MKRATVWCLVGVLALVAGCRRSDEVILLKRLPEIEMSGMDEFVDFGPAEISQDRLWVVIPGKAKQDLGQAFPVTVTRYMGGERLDTITARVVRDEPMPGAPVAGPEGAPPGVPAGPWMEMGPQAVPPVASGEKVKLSVDSTTNKGVITKLVFAPEPE